MGRPTAVSLFTGCGGSDSGLVALGVDVLMANDVIRYASEVYHANLPETEYVLGDVQKIESFPHADLLVGCYPCQGYSQGGARKANRQINFLFQEFGRALRQIRPRAFIVENVSGLLRADNQKLFSKQLRNFRSAGYSVKSAVLNAADFGIPQNRKRIFIVGTRSDIHFRYEFPYPTHSRDGLSGKPYLTVKQALDGMPTWPEGEFNDEPFHWYYLSRDRRCGWDEVAKTIVSRARHVPLHPCSPRLQKIGPDKYKFESDQPARRFSYRECAVLQGFDQAMKFPETCGKHSRYRVVGNSVPPALFSAVALPLLKAL